MMTYAAVIAYGKKVTRWQCGRALNNRGVVITISRGNVMYRCDTKQRTSVKEMIADNFEREGTYDLPK